MGDLRYAARTLRRSPAFTATAVAVLTLGIGTNTAIFSVVNRVLLQPLPYPEPDRLVQLMVESPYGDMNMTSLSRFVFWREFTRAFEYLAAYDLGGPAMKTTSESGSPEQFNSIHVSADYFLLFGVKTVIGRTFTSAEDRFAGPQVAVISHRLWRQKFGGDLNLAGKTIVLDDESYRVIGVLRPGFESEPPADMWLPLQASPATLDHTSRVRVAARLLPGVTLEMANRQMRFTEWRFSEKFPRAMSQFEHFAAEPLRDIVVGDVRPVLVLLSGAVSFVLIIACANLANLQLARATSRSREIATRAALGAARSRIILQLLTESVLLSLGGGALGLGAGYLGVRALVVFNPGHIPRVGAHGSAVMLDWRVLTFVLLTSVFTGVLFGLIPALNASRVDLSATFKESSSQSTTGMGNNRARSLLVIIEIALALVLLVGAGLLIRTVVAMHNADRGFEADHVLTLQMPLPGPQFEKTAIVAQLVYDVERRMAYVPGVTAIATTLSLPLEPSLALPFTILDREYRGSPYHGTANWRSVSPRYFDVFGIKLVSGRLFTDSDDTTAERVVVINQTMVKKLWPFSDPIGQRILIGKGVRPEVEEPPRRVIGVVADVRDLGLNRDTESMTYVPLTQVVNGLNALNNRSLPLTWVVRTVGEPSLLSARVEGELRQASRGLLIERVRKMNEVVAESTAS